MAWADGSWAETGVAGVHQSKQPTSREKAGRVLASVATASMSLRHRAVASTRNGPDLIRDRRNQYVPGRPCQTSAERSPAEEVVMLDAPESRLSTTSNGGARVAIRMWPTAVAVRLDSVVRRHRWHCILVLVHWRNGGASRRMLASRAM